VVVQAGFVCQVLEQFGSLYTVNYNWCIPPANMTVPSSESQCVKFRDKYLSLVNLIPQVFMKIMQEILIVSLTILSVIYVPVAHSLMVPLAKNIKYQIVI